MLGNFATHPLLWYSLWTWKITASLVILTLYKKMMHDDVISQRAFHYNNVIMGAMASQIGTQPFIPVQIKDTSKLRVTGLCVGNSPVTGEFPAQMASNAENVSIWWRHHAHYWPFERKLFAGGFRSQRVSNEEPMRLIGLTLLTWTNSRVSAYLRRSIIVMVFYRWFASFGSERRFGWPRTGEGHIINVSRGIWGSTTPVVVQR